DLIRAYYSICRILSLRGMNTPEFPGAIEANAANEDHFRAKRYWSAYLSVENRFELMRHLHVRSADQIVHGAARRVARMDGNYIVDVNTTAYSFKIKTKSVIVATGRFGSLSCDFDALLLPWSYRRIEVGLRIEQPAGEFFLRDDPYLDSKYVCMSQSGDIN